MRPILDVLPNVSVVIVVKEASKTLKFLQLKEELTELINSINQKFNIEEN
jgi:RNase P protein component